VTSILLELRLVGYRISPIWSRPDGSPAAETNIPTVLCRQLLTEDMTETPSPPSAAGDQKQGPATPHAERANVSPVSPGAPPNSLKLK